MANYNDWVSDEGLKKGWLANWLNTKGKLYSGAAAYSWLHSVMIAHDLIIVVHDLIIDLIIIVVKEMKTNYA